MNKHQELEIEKLRLVYSCENLSENEAVIIWNNGSITSFNDAGECLVEPPLEKGFKILLPETRLVKNDSLRTSLVKALELREFYRLTIKNIQKELERIKRLEERSAISFFAGQLVEPNETVH